MDFVATDAAPTPAGHYSQCVVHGGLAFVAGQLPIDPATGAIPEGADIAQQTRQTLANLRAILRAAGSDLDKVLKVTVYVPDISCWGELNAVYAEVFGDHKPARAVVPSRELNKGAMVEIEAVAAV